MDGACIPKVSILITDVPSADWYTTRDPVHIYVYACVCSAYTQSRLWRHRSKARWGLTGPWDESCGEAEWHDYYVERAALEWYCKSYAVRKRRVRVNLIRHWC